MLRSFFLGGSVQNITFQNNQLLVINEEGDFQNCLIDCQTQQDRVIHRRSQCEGYDAVVQLSLEGC